MKLPLTATLFALTASAASAGTWTSATDKGLDLYTLDQGTVQAQLVCDPEGLWSPVEFHLLVTNGGEVPTGTKVSVSKADETLEFPLTGGAILSTDIDAWNKLIDMLTSEGDVTLKSDGLETVLNITSSIDAQCKRTVQQ